MYIKAPLTFGDALLSKSFLLNEKENFDIYISYHYEGAHRPIGFSNNVINFYRLLYSDMPNAKIVLEKNDLPEIWWSNLYEYGYMPNYLDLTNVFCDKSYVPEIDNYICIYTKMRGLHTTIFKQYKQDFLNLIKKLSEKYKIYIIGERQNKWQEYSISGNNFYIYNLYDDYKKIENENFIDKSYPDDLEYNELQFKESCNILKHAKYILTLGQGGNYWIANSVNKTIGLITHTTMADLGKIVFFGKTFIFSNMRDYVDYVYDIS